MKKLIARPLLLACAGLCLGTAAFASPEHHPSSAPPRPAPANSRNVIVHVLNRLAFGPRPGEVEAVQAIGVREWIERQLHPETIDDSAVDEQLATLPTLKLTPAQLMNAYQAETAFRKQQRIMRQERNAGDAAVAPIAAAGTTSNVFTGGTATANTTAQNNAADALSCAGPAAPTRQQPATAAPTQPNRRQTMSRPEEEALAEAERNGFQNGISEQTVGELQTAKLVRAVSSQRELQEVLVDFWGNHFNLDVHKGPVRTLLTADERDVIRPHVLGKFRDLLEASAKSPAMLFYLDNARSTRPYTLARGRKGRRLEPANGAANEPGAGQRVLGGVNENYARELMELHTLGVDGGYTQADVQEVARCFTGWTFKRTTGEFEFRPFLHDDGAKVVLGHNIPAGGGIQDGETVLDILAASPATAHHLAFQLAQRFVADTPPPALVERAARAYLDSGGDLTALTRTIVTSPEFYSPANTGNKIKSPYEFAVSAVRALGGSMFVPNPTLPRERLMLVSDGAASEGRGLGGRGGRGKTLPKELAFMGEPMFGCQPPTGYPENSSSWVSTGALVERLNFALALANNGYADVVAPPLRVSNDDGQADEAVDELSLRLTGTQLTPATAATIEKQFPAQTPIDLKQMCALILGSPEFQRR